MDILYTAHATATGGGRNLGHAVTDDGKVDVQLSVPKDMGGPGGDGTNPEQLFAAGYSACFLGALRAVGAREKTPIPPEASVSAAVGIGQRDDKAGFGLAVELTINAPGLARETVEDLVAKAHIMCPYSNATRGNIDVKLTVA